MLKQILILGFLFAGIAGAVLVIQKPTLLKSWGYDVIDFVSSFHAKEGEAEFNPNLDIYKDGMINVLDVLKDRYAQEASRSGAASDSGNLTRVLDASDSAEASDSAN